MLQSSGLDQPRWNSERLLMHALGFPRSKLYSNLQYELSEEELAAFEDLLRKRSKHYPLAYIEGIQEFCGREFVVDESVLIPRPETEEIIKAVLALSLPKSPLILDLGSGSGVIAITLALSIPDSFAVALEMSEAAIHVIRRNQIENVSIIRGDFRKLCFRRSKFNLIAANLPYIEQHEYEALPTETLWEPKEALLVESLENLYSDVIKQSLPALAPGGYLVMEIGAGQHTRLSKVASQVPGLELLKILEDKRGIPRVLLMRKEG